MAPKKDPKKKADNKNAGFNEVAKAMLESEIVDLNRKLARLRTAIQDYEVRNEELQNAYDKLDEDRADIITYLKKTLHSKSEENIELKERVQALEDLRVEETARTTEVIKELEKNFTTMKAQLTSENKLLAGKLNTLEEFRAIREDLLKRFERQEQQFEDQEMKYKRVIYDAEKKFVVGKDKLKKEMEARLLHLAQDFQDASESRIAASTHRVIRENIALNNQLDNLLFTQTKVAEQNEKYKEDERNARNAMEVAEAERDKAINKSIVQLKIIDQLTIAFQNVQKNKALHDRKVLDFEKLQTKAQKLSKENENMALQIKILEQNLHASLGQHNKHVVEASRMARERDMYKKTIKDATCVIQASLKVDQWAIVEPAREIVERKIILNNILDVLHRKPLNAESGESLVSFTNVYETGDLGFVPKPIVTAKLSKTSVALSISQLTPEDKSDSSAGSTESSSVKSIKTAPSLSIMSPAVEISISSRESIPSFTVTSHHSSKASSETESAGSTAGLTDVEKQLALSKLEIQKSILKDLQVSQVSFQSKSRLEIEDSTKSRTSMINFKSKSSGKLVTDQSQVVFNVEDAKSTEDKINESHEESNEPVNEKLQSEDVNDKDKPADVGESE